jgi:hypothetical protein
LTKSIVCTICDRVDRIKERAKQGTEVSAKTIAKSVPGFKGAKDRFTVLVGGNAVRNCKLKPVMVYDSANLHALKGYMKHLLPMRFYSDAKKWVTGPLFVDCLTSKLEDKLPGYCAKENLAIEIVLIVDNAPGHHTITQNLCEHIAVVFILPESVSVIQLMIKEWYQHSRPVNLEKFDMLVKAVDDKNMSVKEFWKSFTIRDAVMLVCEVWTAITHLCMSRVWKKLCPYLLHDCKGFSAVED